MNRNFGRQLNKQPPVSAWVKPLLSSNKEINKIDSNLQSITENEVNKENKVIENMPKVAKDLPGVIQQSNHYKNNDQSVDVQKETDKNLPKVINGKKGELKKLGYNSLQDWLKNPNHVYIGRDMTWAVKGAVGSKWHNPFKVNDYGLDLCLEKFEDYIMKNKELLSDIHELRGKDLCCWCKPERCHGDILLKLANEDVPMKKPEDLLAIENFPSLSQSKTIEDCDVPKKIISYKDRLKMN